jgi:hypothetical protein
MYSFRILLASKALLLAARAVAIQKRSHDTIALYQGDVARHRIGIVCLSEGRDAGLVAYHLRKTASF